MRLSSSLDRITGRNACYVGENYILKHTANLGKLKKHIEVSEALSDIGLASVLPRQIIHRDPNPGNIICAADQWGFIDFDLAERNVRIYDPCYAATAVLSETFGEHNERWLDIYRDIVRGYDSVAHLTEEEKQAIPYIILANQFVCVAWFSQQEQYAEIYETNKRMTAWLIGRFDQLQVV